MGRGRVVATAAISAALGLIGVGGASIAGPVRSAAAQQSLIDSDPAVVQARAELTAAQAAAHEAESRLEQSTEQLNAVQGKIADDQAQVTELDAQRAQYAFFRDTLLDRVRRRAQALYRAGGDGSGIADILSGSALDGVRREQLGDAAYQSDRTNVHKLEAARTALAATQARVRREEDDLRSQQAALDSLRTQLEQQQATADQQVAKANAALERARVIGALRAARDPIMGPPTLTADQIVQWFNTQGYHPRLADTTVTDLVSIFLGEGSDEGVRGDFAFAQAVVETGGFSSAPDHNYSGLGWCDSCARGTVFPTPRDGIRAQIQLLLNYADINSRAAGLHHPPSPYWWDRDPTVAAHDFDTYFAKGWAPTWSDMGHGNWATDPGYAAKVIRVYDSMVTYAQSH
jgi:hypothetical protein